MYNTKELIVRTNEKSIRTKNAHKSISRTANQLSDRLTKKKAYPEKSVNAGLIAASHSHGAASAISDARVI